MWDKETQKGFDQPVVGKVFWRQRPLGGSLQQGKVLAVHASHSGSRCLGCVRSAYRPGCPRTMPVLRLKAYSDRVNKHGV